MPAPLLQVRNLVKAYGGLRPLRVQALDVDAGDAIALMGFDQGAAEVLVNLLTAAVLPDAGTVSVCGAVTSSITNPQDWVRFLDQFGLLSERAVLLDELTTAQNLAMPLSLQVHSMPAEVRDQVGSIADEVALPPADLNRPLAALSGLNRQRVRLGRALALQPRVLLAEHANAPLSGADTRAFAADLARVSRSREMALLAITADREFATAITSNVVTLQPATGVLQAASGWRRWLG
jgi:ABC-type methionine transport system ATPase subunit